MNGALADKSENEIITKDVLTFALLRGNISTKE